MKFLLLSVMAAVASGVSSAHGEAVLRNGDSFCLRLKGTPVELANVFSLKYTVGNDGMVSIPHTAAPIKASGLTITQLERGIEKQLVEAKIFMQPTAKITSPDYRYVTVGGFVGSPGEVEWSPELTLSIALKRAGGIGGFVEHKVRVTRDGKTTIYDQKRYEKDPNRFPEQNPKLLPGDEVDVPGN